MTALLRSSFSVREAMKLGWEKTRLSLLEALHATRQDLAILLALLASFAGRGDSASITVFLSLWVSDYSRDVLHSTGPQAIATAGMVTGIVQLAALL